MAGGPHAQVVTTESDAGVPVAPSSWVAEFRWRLAAVDPRSLTDRERVELVAQLERLKATASATQARSVHALSESRPVSAPRDAVRSVGSEVALARRESPSLGDRFVRVSRALVMELPCTLAALDKGVIGERHAVEVVQQSAMLSAGDRAELDRRLGPVLARLTPQGAGRAARRVAAELDAASVVARLERAARSRRVSVRPAADGMAYLSILAPRHEAVGAYAALRAHAGGVVGGQRHEEPADGRGVGAVMADTATRLLSGRAVGQVQPVEVHLVMTDRALLGVGNPGRSQSEPARIPGHGSVPAPVARAWVRNADDGSVWLRRLFTTPDGRDLVGMESRRRLFTGLLRRMLVLRDDVCPHRGAMRRSPTPTTRAARDAGPPTSRTARARAPGATTSRRPPAGGGSSSGRPRAG